MKSQFLEYTEYPEEHKLNSLGTSVIKIVKAGIGTGMLTAPYIYKECGFILAPILLFVCPILAYFAFSMTLDVIDNVDQNNTRLKLFDAVKTLLGDKYLHALRIINMMYNFGTSTGYILLIIKTMIALFQLPQTFIIKAIFAIILGALYIPISLNRNLAYITKYSTTAIFVQVFIFILIVINSLTYIQSEGIPDETYENKFNAWEIPFHFGLIFFLYDMCNVYSDVRNSMRYTSQSRAVLQYYYFINFLIANIMGAATYFAYGLQTDDIAFRNIEKGGIFQNFSIFINAAYVACLLISLTIFNFTMIMLLEKYVGVEEVDRQKQGYLRIGVYSVQSLIAIFIPSFTALMSFQGSLWTVLILFVFPYLCIQKLSPHYSFIQNKRNQYKLITFLGVLAGISGFVSEIM